MVRSAFSGLKFIAISVVSMLGFAVAPASATVITIGTTGATLTCSVSCEAFSGAGGLDIDPGPPDVVDPTGAGTAGTLAQLYRGEPSSPSDEGSRLATLVGSPVGAGVQSGSNPDPVFDSSASYLVLKIGRNDIFIINTSGGSQTYTYAQNNSTGLGLSHYTEFGGSEVPLPAAVWLMAAGLAGLGFAGRRSSKA